MKCDPGFLPIRPTPRYHPSRNGTVPFRSQGLCQGLGLAGVRQLRKPMPQRVQLREKRSVVRPFLGIFSDLFDGRMHIRHKGRNCNTGVQFVSMKRFR